jgi:hypothetical protein
MIIDKLPNQGDFSGQPFEFQLSGVREMWAARTLDFDTDFYFSVTTSEQATSNYTVGQSYAYVIIVDGTVFENGTFTVAAVTAETGGFRIDISLAIGAGTYPNFYPAKSNSAFASSIAVTITDTVTSEATTFNFPVTTAGDAQFYLGSFIDDAIRAKGLAIPNVTTTNARAGNYNITVNNVVLNYFIGFGGRFNAVDFGRRSFIRPIKLFRREGGTFITSKTDYGTSTAFTDDVLEFADYPNPEGDGFFFRIYDTCKKKDYQLKTLQIGSNTYDVTAPILRFLNPIGGVEEAWASGNNELTLNQGDTRFYQTILGETKIAGRNNSYQGMTLELVPQDYLTDLRAIEAEINRLAAIQYSDYVELVVQDSADNWVSIPVIVTPNSFVIASNNSNQLRQSISFEITFASPL